MPVNTDFEATVIDAMHLMDHNADSQKLNGDSDHDFVHLILTHHQSAMEMAHAEIAYGQMQMMKDMAQKMIDMR